MSGALAAELARAMDGLAGLDRAVVDGLYVALTHRDLRQALEGLISAVAAHAAGGTRGDLADLVRRASSAARKRITDALPGDPS